MYRTSVIIPNYNGLKFLPQCMEALKVQIVKDFMVIVVDNGSTDGSLQWIKDRLDDSGVFQEAFPLKLIELGENTGFAPAVNRGIEKADTEYVLLLNNDTIPEPDFIEKMQSAIQKDEKLFAVSALMIKASDHRLVDSAGDGMTILGWAYQRGIDEPVEKYQKQEKVFSACAGAAIYRRKIFDEIGLFDEMHFAYLEDIDISWRARLYGYEILYEPAARVYHLGSATSGSRYNSFKVRLSSRNNILLHYKNQSKLQKIVNHIPLQLGILGKRAFFKNMGYLDDYNQGIKEGKALRSSSKLAKTSTFSIYMKIEGMMIAGMAKYLVSYIKRHI